MNGELWVKTDPNTLVSTTEGADFKNGGFSISVSVILPIGAGKSDDDGK